MPNQTDVSILRRMVAPPREPVKEPAERTKDAHIRVEFPRGADELHGLMLEVSSIGETNVSKTEVIDGLGPYDLTFGLLGKAGEAGILGLDAELLSALIEVQTTGRISSKPTPERPPSRTDGVVVSDIVDRWLRDVVPPGAQAGATGFLFAGAVRENRLMEPRAVALALDPGAYTCLRITMVLGNGEKTGVLKLVLPGAASAAGAGERLAATVGGAGEGIASLQTELFVDMARFIVPLSKIRNLAFGDVLAVPDDQLGVAILRGIDGSDTARGELGQMEGRWAVRCQTGLDSPNPTTEGSGHFQVLSAETEGDNIPPEVSSPNMPNTSPTASDVTEIADLPPLPDLPDLPDLPELPDLPDLQ